ncbi:MAG: RNA-binding protein [Gammaproteobacteria bacterium]|nr:RNA-binding protein [Gammaproteobacteria bacterium]
MSQNEPADVRLDKWLWAARFYKTRSLASAAVNGGRVQVNGQRSKTSRLVNVGDIIEIAKPPYRYTLSVKQLSDKRGSGLLAQSLYEEHPASLAARTAQAEQYKLLGGAANPHPDKRPDKRSRRQLKQWQGKT